MNERDLIATQTIKQVSEGGDKVRADLKATASAQDQLAASSTNLAAATETSARRQTSAAAAYNALQMKADPASRALSELERAQRTLARAQDQGVVSQGKANEVLSVFVARANAATAAANAAAVAEENRRRAQSNASVNQGQGFNPSSGNYAAMFGSLLDVADQKAMQIGRQFGVALDASLIAGVAKSARDSASVFTAEMDRLDQIASAKAQQIGKNFQDSLNQRMGIGGSSKSARDSAAVFEEAARGQDAMAASAMKLRAAINPLEAEQGRLAAELRNYKQALDAGKISQTEFAAAHTMASKRLGDFAQNLKTAGTAGRVMSGELVNMGYQLNDVVTGLALGQSPFMILAQQGGQITQILQNSRASIGEFAKTAAASFMGMLTPMRLFIGGAAAVGLAGATAAYDWTKAQDEIERALIGIGRRTGTTGNDINKFASDNATATGLSVSQARQAAVEFASTGQIAITQLKGLGDAVYGFSILTGKDATESAKTLAKALSGDLVAGAKDLDQVYGALDGRSLQLIATLQATGDRQQAQQIIVKMLEEQNKKAADSVGLLTKAYNLLGNEIAAMWEQAGKSLTFSLPGDRRSPLEVASETNKGQMVKDTAAGDDAVRELLPQIAAYEKLLKLQEDLNKARASPGAQGLGGFNEAAATAAANAAASVKEALQTSINYNERVREISQSWGDVSQSTALALEASKNQRPVIEAIGGAARMAAQYAADYANALNRGRQPADALVLAADRLKNSQAAAVASANQTTQALSNQNDLQKAGYVSSYDGARKLSELEMAEAKKSALERQASLASQQAYNKVLEDTGDKIAAQNKAREVGRSYEGAIAEAADRAADAQKRSADAALEWQQNMLGVSESAMQAADASQRAAEAFENAARASSKGSFSASESFTFGSAGSATSTIPLGTSFSSGGGGARRIGGQSIDFWRAAGFKRSMAEAAERDASMQSSGYWNDTADDVLSGGGSFDAAIAKIQQDPNSGAEISAAKASSLAGLYNMKNAQTDDRSIQLSNDQQFMAWLKTQPATIAVQSQMTNLAAEMSKLSESTDSLNGTMRDALSPYYTQDPRTSHIGFRAGFAEGGSFTVPGGTSMNDNMMAHIPLASGEKVTIDPPSVRNQSGASRGGPSQQITIHMPVTIQGNANKDEIGRTMYQAAQDISRQLRAS